MQDDAAEAEWFDVSKPPSKLAFDHKLIVRTAFEHLLKQHTGKGEDCGAYRNSAGMQSMTSTGHCPFTQRASGYPAAISDTYWLA